MNYSFNSQEIEEDPEWYDGLGNQEEPEMKEAIKIQDPISEMTLINGKKLLSLDAILYAGTILSRKIALSISNGVDKKIKP